MYSKEEFIKDWDAANIEPDNVAEIKAGHHYYWIYIKLVPDSFCKNTLKHLEAYEFIKEGFIAGSYVMHNIGEQICEHYSSKPNLKIIKIYNNNPYNLLQASLEAREYYEVCKKLKG